MDLIKRKPYENPSDYPYVPVENKRLDEFLCVFFMSFIIGGLIYLFITL